MQFLWNLLALFERIFNYNSINILIRDQLKSPNAGMKYYGNLLEMYYYMED